MATFTKRIQQRNEGCILSVFSLNREEKTETDWDDTPGEPRRGCPKGGGPGVFWGGPGRGQQQLPSRRCMCTTACKMRMRAQNAHARHSFCALLMNQGTGCTDFPPFEGALLRARSRVHETEQ